MYFKYLQMYLKYSRKYSTKIVFEIEIQNTPMYFKEYFKYMHFKYCPSLFACYRSSMVRVLMQVLGYRYI